MVGLYSMSPMSHHVSVHSLSIIEHAKRTCRSVSPEEEHREHGEEGEAHLGLEAGRTPALPGVLLRGKAGLLRAEAEAEAEAKAPHAGQVILRPQTLPDLPLYEQSPGPRSCREANLSKFHQVSDENL